MAQAGIKLEVDSIGRIYIPKRIREQYGIEKDFEVLLHDEGIYLRCPRYALVEREEKV